MSKPYTELEENFFDFAAERVWYIGTNGPKQETDDELDKLTKEIIVTVDPDIWIKYQIRISIYNDHVMYESYKQGFMDALLLLGASKK